MVDEKRTVLIKVIPVKIVSGKLPDLGTDVVRNLSKRGSDVSRSSNVKLQDSSGYLSAEAVEGLQE